MLQLFVLPQGEAIGCKSYKFEPCGMHLIQCGNGEIDLICLTNVTYQGPVPLIQPLIDEPGMYTAPDELTPSDK